MNESTILVNIITPSDLVLSCDAVLVTMPGENGEFGVLAGHIPLTANLNQGIVRIENADFKLKYLIDKAVVKVTGDEVNILTEFAFSADTKPVIILEKIADYKSLLTTATDQEHINFIKDNLIRYEEFVRFFDYIK